MSFARAPLCHFENVFVHPDHIVHGAPSALKWSDFLKKKCQESVSFDRGVNINFFRDLYVLNMEMPVIFTNDNISGSCLKVKLNRKMVVLNTGPQALNNGAKITVAPPICKSADLPLIDGVYPLGTYDAHFFDVQINQLLVWLKIFLDIENSLEDKTLLESDDYWDHLSRIAHENMAKNYFWTSMCKTIAFDIGDLPRDGSYSPEILKTICEISRRYWTMYISPMHHPGKSVIYKYSQPFLTDNRTISNCIAKIIELSAEMLPGRTPSIEESFQNIRNSDTHAEGKKSFEQLVSNRKELHGYLMAMLAYLKRFKCLRVAKIMAAKSELILPCASMDILTTENEVQNPLLV